MKAHYDIEQRTEEWHQLKWGKIGGTLASGLFVDSDTLLIGILSQLTEDFQLSDDGFISSAMQDGIDKEPYAIQALCDYTGISFSNCGWLQSESNPLLGISPDAITDDEETSAEIKCLGKTNHMKVIMGGTISKDHIHQNIHYFTVNPKLKRHFCCYYRPENKIKPLFVIELTRDSLVDIGWSRKGKVTEDRGHGVKEYVSTEADVRTVQEWVDLAIENSELLQVKIDESIKQLNF
jgi:hypothetical protein